MAVVSILMIFSAVSPGVVNWVEGVAKGRRGQSTDPRASPAFIESPEKDGEKGKNRRVWCPQRQMFQSGRSGIKRLRIKIQWSREVTIRFVNMVVIGDF